MEQYALFAAYQSARHSDSDMSRMGFDDYAAMVEEGAPRSSLFQMRDAAGELRGAVLTDRLPDGFSAVYSFYETDPPGDSLGSALILKLVERAGAEGLPYVYLGYWIAGSRKMAYKTRFQPLEALREDGWSRVE